MSTRPFLRETDVFKGDAAIDLFPCLDFAEIGGRANHPVASHGDFIAILEIGGIVGIATESGITLRGLKGEDVPFASSLGAAVFPIFGI